MSNNAVVHENRIFYPQFMWITGLFLWINKIQDNCTVLPAVR